MSKIRKQVLYLDSPEETQLFSLLCPYIERAGYKWESHVHIPAIEKGVRITITPCPPLQKNSSQQ